MNFNSVATFSALLAFSLISSGTQAAIVQYPGKAAVLAAIHADLVNISGFATPSLTPHPALSYLQNGRAMVIDSDIGGSTRLMSWGTGVGAPNPSNTTTVYTQGRPSTAFGCFLRVANNVNQSVGGTVQITTNAESLTVSVPPSGMYVAFSTTTLFDHVSINATSGSLVEMIEDVFVADAAGRAASDYATDAGRATPGSNSFDTRFSQEDQTPFFIPNGLNYGNSRDVWWSYVPPQNGIVSLTPSSTFSTLLSVYDGTGGVPGTGAIPMNYLDGGGTLQQQVLAGHTYYIRLGGFGAVVGTGNMTLTFTADSACPADFNRDGQIDFFDYLDFVAAFSIGC